MTKGSLKTTVQAIADEDRFDLDAHPTLDQLADHLAGKLSADDDERIRDHLALCHMCIEFFLDLADFPQLEPPKGVEPPSEQEVADAWRETGPELLAAAGIGAKAELGVAPVESRQGETVAAPGPAHETHGPVGQPWAFLPRRVAAARFALASAALSLLVLSGVWIGWLYRQLAVRSGPQFAAVIDIDTSRGLRPYRVSPLTERILLLFRNVDLGSYFRGELEISQGDTVLYTGDLEPSPDDRSLLHLSVPRELLPAGSYRVRIFGLDSGGRKLLKDLGLTLEDSG